MTFLLCDPGWCVHKSDAQKKWDDPFKFHEEVLFLHPLIPPKRFDIFPPDWGMLRKSRGVQIKQIRFFFKNPMLLPSGNPFKFHPT